MYIENEILTEVINIASAGLAAELTDVKRCALADIADALASVIPCERESGRGIKLPRKNRSKIQSMTGDLSVVAKAMVGNRIFVAEADWENDVDKNLYREGFVAHVREKSGVNGWHIARIEFNPKVGGNAVKKMFCGMLKGISSHYGHKARLMANKRSRLTKEEA